MDSKDYEIALATLVRQMARFPGLSTEIQKVLLTYNGECLTFKINGRVVNFSLENENDYRVCMTYGNEEPYKFFDIRHFHSNLEGQVACVLHDFGYFKYPVPTINEISPEVMLMYIQPPFNPSSEK